MNICLPLIIIVLFSLIPRVSVCETIFEYHSSQGYQYLGPQNAHPGGGYFSWLGGDISKPEGTGCQDPANYHNTVISADAAAANSSTGSSTALKTPYRGACPTESFGRDTTIINTPPLSEYYIRWYQKWTGSFQASIQQKFAKFYNSADHVESTITGYFTMRANNYSGNTPGAVTGLFENYMPNIDGHFNKSGCALYEGNIWVTPVAIANGDCYAGQARGFDDSTITVDPIIMELNRWYTFEIHSKLNTDANTSDAVYEIRIDGVLRMSVTNFKFRDGIVYNSEGSNIFEFQHIYYNRSDLDQSTYMDGIIISTSPIPAPSHAPMLLGSFLL